MITNLEEPPSVENKRTRFLIKKIRILANEVRTLFFVNSLKIKVFFSSPIGKRSTLNIILLAFIALIPWVSEASVNSQIYRDISMYSDPIDPMKAGTFVEDISKYTPGIEEKKSDVALSMMITKNEYDVAKQLQVNEGTTTPEPVRQAATYTVAQGETITQIAEKFNLHVATILDANNISPTNTKNIKEGMELSIPKKDTSTSDDWIVAIKKAEEEERKAAEEKRQKELAAKQTKVLAASTSRSLSARSSTQQSSAYDGTSSGSLIVPISHNGISRGFGGGHTGIDYMAPIGTSVAAADSGKVTIVSSGWNGGYGNQIVVDHGGGRTTRYAHLSGFAVSAGDYVSQGQVIGYSGSSGRSTGPHLHFELIIGGRPVPPF
ncbi:hypothetical protein COT77_00285 [Candidatus Berkelbacteria bacterium CG10_big_fil_rev_8_21_14_0_10_41_12]|uniref:LysM domain-containing protein n=1 Tax=Candidatus Berkelbacteria bacterium CG10_big_fil_rev_8_21_14_0_10_41_12 TaxID=1974513 RepID=A0A2M6WXZ6_9BACT|nr:MAG: hypothetical protein COT77_00285 [Candidatus Berkelbacteria bacterium CG10_big_fil_rev_8_21_14_0_10_41_12]